MLDLTQFPSQQLFWFGAWERKSARLMAEHLHPGGVALDVGANIGIFTVLMAERVGSTGRVHAFEPDPRNFALLAENIERNSLGASASQVAVSDSSGTIGLAPEEDAAFTHLAGPMAPGGPAVLEVPMTSIDEYAIEMERLDLVKVDVEGGESAVLSGAGATLRRLRPALLVECAAHHLARNGITPVQLLLQLEALGYRTYATASMRQVTPSERIPVNDNLWCIPQT